MSKFKVTTNANEVGKRMINRGVAAEKLIKQLIYKATSSVEKDVKLGINTGPASGKRRRDDSRASAPGEYPMADKGELAGKVSFDIRGNTGIVTSSAKYSKHLEYGTQKMKARPFMFPSLEKNRARILKMFKEARLLRRTS